MSQSTKFGIMDVLGKALLDYQNGDYREDIKTYSSFDEEDVIPIPYLFRAYDQMPKLEQKALALCKGHILDIGCGAGSHSLYLQQLGKNVTALDSSKGAIVVCKIRGVKKTVLSNILEYREKKFDTLLLLMNGIGLAGKLKELPSFLAHLKSILKPDGQILLDSSDIIYMYDSDTNGGYWIPGTVDYYGEVEFVMEYGGEKSNLFPWLYLDFNTLHKNASLQGFECELVSQGEHYDYLAKLTIAK